MKQIHDIIKYIEDRLDEDVSVLAVAAYSGYSPYHFQRMFTHCLGVTLGAYIRLRRLTKAATNLGSTDQRIIEISQQAGFESQEAFTRAFKSLFHKTPARYRKEGSVPVLKAFPVLEKELARHLGTNKALATPRFHDGPSMTLIGLSAQVTRGRTQNITTELWPQFVQRMNEIPQKRGGQEKEFVTYGVLKEGGSSDGQTHTQFHYCAAVEVAPQTQPPDGMKRIDIAPHRYAVFTHDSGMESLPLTNQYIWGIWALQNNVAIANSPDLEVYPSTFNPRTNPALEIWAPLDPSCTKQ